MTQEGWVSYESFKGKDAAELRLYLKDLAGADPAKLGDRNAQKAFWINAYNAVCIQTIIDAGVPAEVPHARLFGKNIFTQRTYEVAGKIRSLDDIEHGILRKDFKDPRIHAAVVCGARSCPRLRPEAYTGDKLDKQLDEEAKSWITVETTGKGVRKNHLDRPAKTYYVSMLFYWYRGDFEDSEEGVLRFLKKHGDDGDRELLEKNKVRIEYLDYNWSSNKQ